MSLRFSLLHPLVFASGVVLAASPQPGTKVEWARLRTSAPGWDRHADADKRMLDYFRQHTGIDTGTTWHAVLARLEELRNYPFVFADSLKPLTPTERKNLGEYLRRGGFVLIDTCINASVTPDPELYLREQIDVLKAELPELQVQPMTSDHEVYRIHFKTRQFPPTGRPGSTIPLLALTLGDRTIGFLSASGIQCGRAGFGEPDAARTCTEMMTNIYLYALTH